MIKYSLEIKPAIRPSDRHKIEGVLQEMGYKVLGGRTFMDASSCDISFRKEESTKEKK